VLVLTAFYRELLFEAGVAVVSMHGANEVVSLAQLELVELVLDVGMGVLLERRCRPARRRREDPHQGGAGPGRPSEPPEGTGRGMDLFGLRREDILVYIEDEALRAVHQSSAAGRSSMRNCPLWWPRWCPREGADFVARTLAGDPRG
jgi:hypothetical protein